MIFFLGPQFLSAQTSTTGNAGLLHSWLGKDSPQVKAWEVGGQGRARYEVKENAGSFPNNDFIRSGVENNNSYFLRREKIHVGYQQNWFSVFVEGRDSSTTGDGRNPNPEADLFDLQQAFLSLGDPQAFPLTWKIGRQEMVYGDERFIGRSDWNNMGRVFDAARMSY